MTSRSWVGVAVVWLAVALASVISVWLLGFIFPGLRNAAVWIVAPILGIAGYEAIMLWRDDTRWLQDR